MTITPDSNGGRPDRPSNVLLLTPSVGADEDAVCEELLHATGSSLTHALLVTFLESPVDRIAAWTDRGDDPDRTTVIDVDACARSTAAASAATANTEGGGADDPLDARVERLADPSDLVALGDDIDRHLVSHESATTSLCFHSLSDALATTDRERVFKFLEVLTRSVEHTNATAHYHLNPDVHDRETVEILEVLFDVVVDLRDDRRAK